MSAAGDDSDTPLVQCAEHADHVVLDPAMLPTLGPDANQHAVWRAVSAVFARKRARGAEEALVTLPGNGAAHTDFESRLHELHAAATGDSNSVSENS